MADEQEPQEVAQSYMDTEANYVIAFAPSKITGVTLVPKTKLRSFIGNVPQPYQFASLHILAGEKDLTHGIPGIALKQIEWYEPRKIAQKLIDDLYYHWMGKTSSQIDADINAVIEGLRGAKKLRGY